MRLFSLIGFLVLAAIRLTTRIKVVRKEVAGGFFKNNRRFILAFWHGRQLMMPYCYHGKSIHILISQHGDGEIVSRAMRFFGFKSIRGSTTRGGSQAFREMIRTSRVSDIAITPDGPRGPARNVQMGIIELARLTGLPILPILDRESTRLNSSHQ